VQSICVFFMKKRYVHLEVEPQTVALLEARINHEVDVSEADKTMSFAAFAHCLNLYSLEVTCMLKSKTKASDLFGPMLNRTLHAMHDAGCFNEKELGQIFE